MKKPGLTLVTVIILAITGSGCSSTTQKAQYQMIALPLPARPALPIIQPMELECLSDETYRALVKRQRLMREYAEELEVIIRPP